MNQRTTEGDEHGYVGEIIDPNWSPEPEKVKPFAAPLNADLGLLPMPEPGVYFGMPDEVYHRVHACSASGLKKLSTSSMDYWATSRMNPDYKEPENRFFDYGKAIHCLVLEGESEFNSRYGFELDMANFDADNLLVSTDQIKAAIGQFKELQPVAPAGTTKQGLIDQLAELGERHGKKVELDGTVPELKSRIKQFSEEQPVRPVSRVIEEDADGNVSTRAASKDDWVAQLLALNPKAKIWDRMVEDHLKQNEGKTLLPAEDMRRIHIAAHMMLGHEQIKQALKGGYPEVSIFWYCPVTGAPMKARLDRLKIRLILDLKTFSNPQGKPIDQAINSAIANYRYNVQHVVYDEAVLALKALLKKDEAAIVSHDVKHNTQEHALRIQFCKDLLKIEKPPTFMFVFQQSGLAPVTRGKLMERATLFSVTASRVRALKEKWIECASAYGCDPWLDIEPVETIDDDQIPQYACDLGKVTV